MMQQQLVRPDGRPLGNPAQQQPSDQPPPGWQRMQALMMLAQGCMQAEREAAAQGARAILQASFTIRMQDCPAGPRVPVVPGLFGTVELAGVVAVVRIKCSDVRRLMAGEAASGQPIPEMGLDPAAVVSMCVDIIEEQRR